MSIDYHPSACLVVAQTGGGLDRGYDDVTLGGEVIEYLSPLVSRYRATLSGDALTAFDALTIPEKNARAHAAHRPKK